MGDRGFPPRGRSRHDEHRTGAGARIDSPGRIEDADEIGWVER
jgi:hypothetical protein